ncbi:MAG TPA: TIGR04438 family Trp-rich protein, partial [Usitatibacteraceae bacterium]|nr:TIGR04438 family Trp-rich protein [Usitatibacteraceae bacterium]
MPFVVIGVILLLLKLADVGPVGNLSWIWVLSPFALAFLWWEVIGPMIGWEKKVAEKKMKDEQKS